MQFPNIEKLNLFFAKIRELTFWQRLFSWGAVRSLSYEAFEEFKGLEKVFQKQYLILMISKKSSQMLIPKTKDYKVKFYNSKNQRSKETQRLIR